MYTKEHISYNSVYLILACIKNERLLKVSGSHVHCESGSISESVQDRLVVTTHH